MAFKFEIISNALVITDTGDSTTIFDKPSRDFYYDVKELESNNKIALYDTSGVNSGSAVLFIKPLDECTDDLGTTFTETVFKAFARANFNVAGGGGISAIEIDTTPTTGGTADFLMKVNSDGTIGNVDPAGVVVPVTGTAVSDVVTPDGNLATSQKGTYDFSQSKDVLNQLIDDIDHNVRTVFNGTDTIGTINTPLVIGLDGDYIEFEIMFNQFGTTQNGVMGELGSSSSSIGVDVATGRLRMRGTGGTWFNSVNILTNEFLVGDRFTVKVINESGTWKSYKDGVFQKNLTSATFTLAVLGNAYVTATSRFNGELAKLKGKAQGVDFDFGSLINSGLATISNATAYKTSQAFLTDAQQATLNDTTINYSEQFYEATFTTGGTVFEKFVIYQKIKGKDTYVGVNIVRTIDTGAGNIDCYRISLAYEYTYDPILGTMTNTGNIMMFAGENEFTYKDSASGPGLFTGGQDGMEKFSKIQFYADGIPITFPTSAIALTACQDFRYEQLSQTFNRNNITEADGTHMKVVTFKDGGIRIKNNMTWERIMTIQTWYHGIFYFGTGVTDNIRNEYFEESTIASPANPALSSTRAFELLVNNPSTGLAGQVESRLSQPLAYANDFVTSNFVKIDANGAKYYNAINNKTVAIGEVWENTQVVKYFAQ